MFAKDRATKDLIKETVDLYSDGTIKQFRTAEKIIRQLINTKTSKKSAEKKIVKQQEIKQEKQQQKEKQDNTMKTYFVTGLKTVKKTYRKKNKTYEYTDKVPFNTTVQAKSKTEAKIFAMSGHTSSTSDIYDFMEEDHFVDDNDPIDISEASDYASSGPQNMKMRSASYVDYDFIPSDDQHLKNEGFCVVDHLFGQYFPVIKKADRKWLIKQLYNTDDKAEFDDEGNYISPLDIGVENMPPIQHYELINGEWVQPFDPKGGFTPMQIYRLCERLDISHYAFDITQKCFLKYVSKNKNYKPFVYFAVNNHCYLVDGKATDDDNHNVVQSLIKQARGIETNVNSNIFDKEEPKNNIYENATIYENIPIEELINYENCIIIYNKTNLNDMLDNIILHYNYVPTVLQYKNFCCTSIKFHKDKRNVRLVVDPNDTLRITWKDVQALCNKLHIEFRNQAFSKLIKQVRQQFENNKHPRHKFTQSERQQIFNDNPNCHICNCKLKQKAFEIDHIIPLACGGSNDNENLQVLCKPCHFVKTKEEKEEHVYVRTSQTESSFNSNVQEIIESPLSSAYAFVETMKSKVPKKYNPKVYSFDINKCRKNRLYYSEYDYPLFTVMDDVQPYEGKSNKPGLYYVETNCYFPMRGNGWYSQAMIEYCLSVGLIEQSDIKYVVYSGLNIPKDFFNSLIEYIYENFGEFAKLAINSMIGCFKPKDREQWKMIVPPTTDQNNMFYHFLKDDGTNIFPRMIGDTWYYQAFTKSFSKKDETEAVLYNMTVEQEAIELHKLATIIKEKGGLVLDLSTDAVTCVFKKDFPFQTKEINGVTLIDGFFYDEEQKVHKYKLEDKDRLKVPKMAQYIRKDTYTMKEKEWNITEDVQDNNFSVFVSDILNNNKSVHIDGRAGTGKSTLIKELQQEMDQRGLNYISLAPTNKSARVINGKTIHKFVAEQTNTIRNQNVDYIFIDEISMVAEMFYKFFIVLKRCKPNIKFIIAGDFNQLLPVNDRVGEVDYKNSSALHELVDGNRIQLSKCRRSDDVLFKMLNPKKIMKLKKQQFGNEFTDYHISFTNAKRKEINKTMMDKYVTKKKKKPLELPALKYDGNSQDVKLLAGMPVIARVNNKEYDIVNNQTFIIEQIKSSYETIVLKDEDQIINVPFDDFQKLFYVAFCITVHKSQGQTFNHPYTIHEFDKFDWRLRYVALSRSTDIKNINMV